MPYCSGFIQLENCGCMVVQRHRKQVLQFSSKEAGGMGSTWTTFQWRPKPGYILRVLFQGVMMLRKNLQYYREAEVLIIDDVYADKYVTFSTGTQNTYWSDFVDSRKNQTIFVSQYHPANPPDNWKGALLDIDSMEIVGFHYSNIDDMPNISVPRKRKIVNAR